MEKEAIPNFYLTVYYHINQGLNPTQIAKKYNLSKQRISYYIKGLKANGLIEKKGFGVWSSTGKQVKNYLNNGTTFFYQSKVRGHAFQFKLTLPRKLKNWDRRLEYLTKNNINFTLVGNKGSIIRIIFKEHKVWLCNNTIIVHYPVDKSFFGRSAKQSIGDAVLHFYSIINALERFLGVDFKIGKEYLFEVTKQHYSLIKNELAGLYLKEGKKLEVRDRKGELWALIDNSLNLQELEQVHSKTAIIDNDNVVSPLMNLLRDNPDIFKEVAESTVLNTRLIKGLQNEVVELTKLVIKLKDGYRE